MAVLLYVGVPGSGKTYESVSSVIIPALKRGRTVCTSIEGITKERADKFFNNESHGKIFTYKNTDFLEPGFFKSLPPGALVVIDEAWSVFGCSKAPSAEVLEYFRMHRHFVCPDTGATTDILLITQTATDLHKALREVVETSLRFVKLKMIGQNNKYKVEVYLGARMRKADVSSSYIRKYDPKIFDLYSSYDGGKGGAEQTVDSRQSMLKGGYMRALLIFGLILLIVCPYIVYRSYKNFVPDRPDQKSNESIGSNKNTANSSGSKSNGVNSSSGLSSSSNSGRKLIGVISSPSKPPDLIIMDDMQLKVESGSLVAPNTYITEKGDTLWLAPSY